MNVRVCFSHSAKIHPGQARRLRPAIRRPKVAIYADPENSLRFVIIAVTSPIISICDNHCFSRAFESLHDHRQTLILRNTQTARGILRYSKYLAIVGRLPAFAACDDCRRSFMTRIAVTPTFTICDDSSTSSAFRHLQCRREHLLYLSLVVAPLACLLNLCHLLRSSLLLRVWYLECRWVDLLRPCHDFSTFAFEGAHCSSSVFEHVGRPSFSAVVYSHSRDARSKPALSVPSFSAFHS